ncbi:MAG: LacI family DNA-binding transcriptional regulator [Pseudomonadota bacterium]
MARRPTIQDVADAAGVSVATVDRVLNGRLKVREETARKVSEAAQRVGYHAVNLIEQRLRAELPELRMGFVLQEASHAFYHALAGEAVYCADQLARTRGQAIIQFAQTQSPSEVADLMRKMRGRVDAVAAAAVNHSRVTEAVIALKAEGIPTYAMLNDFAQGERHAYIGLNNLKVGRTAAWMLGTAAPKPGKIAIFVGGPGWHGHALRETGFRSHFREARPEFEVIDTIVNLETKKLTYDATSEILSKHKDLVGLYVAGGGMEGAIQAIRERRGPGEIALVVNELTPESRTALAEGYVTMVIATPMRAICTELMAMMRSVVLGPEPATQGQLFLEPVIYVPESV